MTNTITAANLSLPTFPIFDLTEKNAFKARWYKYLKHFDTLGKAISFIDDGQNLYIGYEMYEIYENIVTMEESTLTQVNAAFDAYFAPTFNSVYECYLFRQLKQWHGEKIHEFYIRLKEQEQKCGFT